MFKSFKFWLQFPPSWFHFHWSLMHPVWDWDPARHKIAPTEISKHCFVIEIVGYFSVTVLLMLSKVLKDGIYGWFICKVSISSYWYWSFIWSDWQYKIIIHNLIKYKISFCWCLIIIVSTTGTTVHALSASSIQKWFQFLLSAVFTENESFYFSWNLLIIIKLMYSLTQKTPIYINN